MLAVHWIRLPHPLNYLAWLALTTYLGIYLPTFVWLARTGVHRWRLPLWIVAPIVWTGLDWLRGHVMTGFLMASLAHTQYRLPMMIQLAEYVGEYGVTFLIMFVAANVLEAILAICRCATFRELVFKAPWQFVRVVWPIVAVIVLSVFVEAKHASMRSEASQPVVPRIALIQGNTPADWKMDAERQQEIMQEYIQLSRDAVQESLARDNKPVDLVVWPETAFRQNLITVQEGFTPPPGRVDPSVLTAAKIDLAALVSQLGCAVLVGLDRIEIIPDDEEGMSYQAFNSAVFVNKSGKIAAIYDKMHRVPFGEFIPLADWFPFLYRLTPLTGGIVAGKGPAEMWLMDKVLFSPNICYETVVPHLIRRQWEEQFARTSTPPAALVNLTNDAWFWGSSELDMHLACGVFRVVETRTPLLIAANGGLSACIDSRGHIRQVTPRRKPAFLLVDLAPTGWGTGTVYTKFGDWFAGLCVVCCAILALAAMQRVARPASDASHRG
jgi:apolipoprotein N-acyltransferase